MASDGTPDRAGNPTAAPPRALRIQSLGRADAILSALAEAPGGHLPLGRVAAVTGLHKNTAFTLLESLEALGFVRRTPRTRHYCLGPRVYALARQAERQRELAVDTAAALERLRALTDEAVTLAVPDQGRARIVTCLTQAGGHGQGQFAGRPAPYHASAVGKAILAHLPDQDRLHILAAVSLTPLTPRTIRTSTRLTQELDQARCEGFTTALAEEEPDTHAVAAPILSPLGRVLGAIAVWGPARRLPMTRLRAMAWPLIQECTRLDMPGR